MMYMGESHVLTSLSFKNWRSLRNVNIDSLTPITVFIGANSSGKTNILDGLRFLRDAVTRDVDDALKSRGGKAEIRTVDADAGESVQLAFSFEPGGEEPGLAYTLSLSPWVASPGTEEVLADSNGDTWMTSRDRSIEVFDRNKEKAYTSAEVGLGLSALGRTSTYPQVQVTFQFVSQRWQLLEENFMPALRVPRGGSLYPPVFETYELLIPSMLDSMKEQYPQLYSELQSDLKWLLNHVDTLETATNDRETLVMLHEKFHPSRTAPTVSAGTTRIIGMLVAFYALNEKLEKAPGLVAIEEPDASVHPLLLRNFVEQLRNYTEDESRPRQFILTTHNPMLLNLFRPEEVRIVERNERGETTVSTIPMDIANIWLEADGAYNLGNMWTTRALGGVPE
jgi:predicted ATPase